MSSPQPQTVKINIILGILIVSLFTVIPIQNAYALSVLTWTLDETLTANSTEYPIDTVYNDGTNVYIIEGYKDLASSLSPADFRVAKYVLSSGTLTTATSGDVSFGGVTCDGSVHVGPVRADKTVFVVCQDVGTVNIVVAKYNIDPISQVDGVTTTLSAATDDLGDIIYTNERIYIPYLDDAATDSIAIIHMTTAYGSIATIAPNGIAVSATREQIETAIIQDPVGDADKIYTVYTVTTNVLGLQKYIHGSGTTSVSTTLTSSGSNTEQAFVAVATTDLVYVSTATNVYSVDVSDNTVTSVMTSASNIRPIQQYVIDGTTSFSMVNDEYGLYLGDRDTIIGYNPFTEEQSEAALYSFAINVANENEILGHTDVKYYRLDANTFFGAATLTASVYSFRDVTSPNDTIDLEGYEENVDVDLVHDQTIGNDDFIYILCDITYLIPHENVIVADNSDCDSIKVADIIGADSLRELPYNPAGSELKFVHAAEYTNYQIHVTLISGDSEDYDAQIVYDSVAVDRNHFDAGDNVQLRMLYQQCYTLQYIVVLTSEVAQSSNVCADDVIFKEDIITTSLGFTFFNAPWAATHLYNETSLILTTIVRHEPTPYNYTVNIINGTGHVINSTQYNNTMTEIDSQTFNATLFANCTSATNDETPLKVQIFNEDDRMFYNQYFALCGDYLSPAKDLFDVGTGDFEGWGLLMFLPIIFAAIFTRNTAGIGGGILVAFIGVIVTFGLIAVPESAIWLMVFAAIIGILAYKILKD